MKSLLSLVLPTVSTWRYVKNGRAGIGFVSGVLCTKQSGADPVGVNSLTSTEVTLAAGNNAEVSTRLTVFSGRTAATAATIPAATGNLRELIIQNANTSSGAVTITAPTASIYDAGSASASATDVIAIADCARYLSDGTSWFRVTKP